MSVLKHEDDQWPLALIVAYGEPSLEQHMASLAAWDDWFGRHQPFHVIRVFLDAASLLHAKGAAQATQHWMERGAAAHMRNLVQSMLIIVPEEQFGRMQKMSVRKAFDIPGGIFPSLDEAYAWLASPPETVKGLPVELAALNRVRERVMTAIDEWKASGLRPSLAEVGLDAY